MAMERRDRLANLGLLAAAAVVWVLVWIVITTRDPVVQPEAGFIGAALMGLAVALTLTPLMWLTVFGRHRRIAYRGDWIQGDPPVGAGSASSSWSSSSCGSRDCSCSRSRCS